MFMCQRDSFLTQYETEVVSCIESPPEQLIETCKALGIDGSRNMDALFEVILKDTILFPEGGGQPDDRGLIKNIPVLRVVRTNTVAKHYINVTVPSIPSADFKPMEPEEKVLIQLDWKRRFDHMQQHSAQHLITAVADELYKFPTTSWWLGTDDSHIEMDTPNITDDQLQAIEQYVNQKIRDNVPLTVDVVGLDDPKLKTARGRNLPDDVKSDIRIVTMAGIESNVCCGTHVSSLAQLQAIKLMFSEKKKGKCLLHFLAGNRVLNKLSESFEREQKLTQVLKTCTAELVINAQKLNLALKGARKSCLTLSKDLAALEAKKLRAENVGEKLLWLYHRENVDLDFGTALLRELGNTPEAIIMVTLKTEGNTGHLLLRGSEEVISPANLSKLGDQLCEVLDGKGTLRGNLFQAKVSKINLVNKAVKSALGFVQEVFERQGAA